jgi:hypothetical protein
MCGVNSLYIAFNGYRTHLLDFECISFSLSLKQMGKGLLCTPPPFDGVAQLIDQL